MLKFLVIGGDAAGMSAASRAKRNLPDLDVTVLEKTGDVSYSACGMPYNIADPDRPMDDLVVRPATVFREKQGINVLTGHAARSIDPKKKIVSGVTDRGQSFDFSYNKLLIATGGSPILPDLPGFRLPGVMALKSLADGRQIKSYITENRVRKAVIIGMGYIGLEMCEALASLSIDVVMIKPRSVLLPWMARDLAAVVQTEIGSHKVALYPGEPVEKIEQKDNRLMVIGAGNTFDADMVLVAVGLSPNSELAADAGLEIGSGGAIAVDHTLRTSDGDIYAAGDCADTYHVVTGKKAWIPLALRANRAGWAVADNICGKPSHLPGVVGTAVFKVFDLEVARTGLSAEQAGKAGFDADEVVVKARSRAHAHPGASSIWVNMVGDKITNRLLGVQMVGREGVAHRINAAAVALHNRMTVAEFSQVDLAYAPPFGPVWDPLLTAANQLQKRLTAE